MKNNTHPPIDTSTAPITARHGNELTIEHILLSVAIVSNDEGAGQFDDSCARIIEREVADYHGVLSVDARVMYEHTKIERHPCGCECHRCEPHEDLRLATIASGGRVQ